MNFKQIGKVSEIIGYLLVGIAFIYIPELVSNTIIITIGIYFLVNGIFTLLNIILDYRLNKEHNKLDNLKQKANEIKNS